MSRLRPGEMPPFTTAELAGMQLTQTSAMQDTGYILRWVELSTDAHGFPKEAYVADADPTVCGFRQMTTREKEQYITQQDLTGAVIRLPIATSIDRRDRFRLTKRFGVLLAPAQDWDVVGVKLQGPSGIQVYLQSVTNG